MISYCDGQLRCIKQEDIDHEVCQEEFKVSFISTFHVQCTVQATLPVDVAHRMDKFIDFCVGKTDGVPTAMLWLIDLNTILVPHFGVKCN